MTKFSFFITLLIIIDPVKAKEYPTSKTDKRQLRGGFHGHYSGGGGSSRSSYYKDYSKYSGGFDE